MPGHLNITAVAHRTGVPAETLRKWEQRYGVLRPARSAGGHRRYSDVDVARVEWLRDRLGDGYRIGDAARLLGTTDLEPPQTPARLRRALYAAIAAGNGAAAERYLDQTFALHPLDRALSQIIAPLLEQIGNGWESGELTVAHEHAASAAVRARLDRLLSDVATGVRGTAVLACAPGERHELGLLMLAVLMRADGWRIVFLGADTPVGAAVALAGVVDANVLAFSSAMPDFVADLREGLAVSPPPPDVVVVIGGRAASDTLRREVGARPTDGKLPAAVRALRRYGR